MYSEKQSILMETLNKAYRELTCKHFIRFLDEAWDVRKNCMNEKLSSELKDTLKHINDAFDLTIKHIEGLT